MADDDKIEVRRRDLEVTEGVARNALADMTSMEADRRRAAVLLAGGLLIRMADGRPDWGGIHNAAWKALEILDPETYAKAQAALDGDG